MNKILQMYAMFSILFLLSGCVCGSTGKDCTKDSDCGPAGISDTSGISIWKCEQSQCNSYKIPCLKDADCDDKDATTADSCTNPGQKDAACAHEKLSCTDNANCDDGNIMTADTCKDNKCIHSFDTGYSIEVYFSNPDGLEDDQKTALDQVTATTVAGDNTIGVEVTFACGSQEFTTPIGSTRDSSPYMVEGVLKVQKSGATYPCDITELKSITFINYKKKSLWPIDKGFDDWLLTDYVINIHRSNARGVNGYFSFNDLPVFRFGDESADAGPFTSSNDNEQKATFEINEKLSDLKVS